MKNFAATALAAAFALGMANASTTIFEEMWDPDTDPVGNGLNFSAFTNWEVTDGFVDLIPSGTFQIVCPGFAGSCVDIDGSAGNATGATLTTKTEFLFEAGREYTFSVLYSGNQRSSADDTITFAIDGLTTDTITDIAEDTPFTTFSITFIPSINTMAAIIISTPGPLDNVGPIVDRVLLTVADLQNPVPVPGALPLFLAGAAGFGALKRRRAAKTS